MKRQLQFNEKVLFEWHSGVTAFWTANPGAWFELVEELFHTQEIVNDGEKFDHEVGPLEHLPPLWRYRTSVEHH